MPHSKCWHLRVDPVGATGQGNRFVIRGKTFPLPHRPWEANPAVTHNRGSSN
jgi:hypothetical protein